MDAALPGSSARGSLVGEYAAGALRTLVPDAVINCAGAVGGGALALAGVNARGPAVLCEALADAVPGARLVHLGSAAEYGPGEPGRPSARTRSPPPRRVRRDQAGRHPCRPRLGSGRRGPTGVQPARARLTGGEPARPVRAELRLAMRQDAYCADGSDGSDGSDDSGDADEPDATVRVGDLSAHRDFVEVRDVAVGAGLAATEPGEPPRLLNIGGGRARPVREVAEGLVRESGFRGRVEESGGSARSAAVSWQQADIGAADRLLGRQPRYSLAESLTGLWAESRGPAETPAR